MNFKTNQKIIDTVINYPIFSSFGIIYGQIYKPKIDILDKKKQIQKHLYRFIFLRYGISEYEITTRDRKANKIKLREFICFYLRNNNFSLNEIGHIVGGRDHTTVINALKKANGYKQFDEKYYNELNNFITSFDLYLNNL